MWRAFLSCFLCIHICLFFLLKFSPNTTKPRHLYEKWQQHINAMLSIIVNARACWDSFLTSDVWDHLRVTETSFRFLAYLSLYIKMYMMHELKMYWNHSKITPKHLRNTNNAWKRYTELFGCFCRSVDTTFIHFLCLCPLRLLPCWLSIHWSLIESVLWYL